ncbi:uncharacterized protein ARMOST_17933 [Armillaria ostoyae]|uniref:Uncharacterized protein n=1 Tax=Armillaria ostoyae TaxID=47428 RepID=A0A284S0E0_ARMOS|nr:uncharacterized protein ARMOST_17933 [Armillaria ostoyae]
MLDMKATPWPTPDIIGELSSTLRGLRESFRLSPPSTGYRAKIGYFSLLSSQESGRSPLHICLDVPSFAMPSHLDAILEHIATHFNGDQTYTSASTDLSLPFCPALADNFSMFSSAPFLQDVAVSGYLDQWRKLFAISVAFPAHHAHHSHPGANPDFYACVKEVGVSWNLHFDINTWRIIRSSTLSDAQLLPVLTNNDIRTVTLNGEIPSVLDRYSLLNWKELFLYKCNIQAFSYFRPISLSTFKGIWKLRSTSSTKLAITVTSATRADVHVARELMFEEGKPGVLPELQHSRWRAPEGIYTFQDNSLLKIASSRCTRCPGGFMIKTKMDDRDVLSEDIIAQMR